MVRCSDNSLYCGITTDVDRRLSEHNSQTSKAAKYTRSRSPVQLVYREYFGDKETALKREFAIKQLSKRQKESLL